MLSNKFASSCFGMEKILGRYLTIGTSIKKKGQSLIVAQKIMFDYIFH